MANVDTSTIERVREASRRLVRELGFMEETLAGTGLSASGVHAIIEVGSGRATNARDLAEALRLEKSTISRLLKNLIREGYLVERRDGTDARLKQLALTEKGKASLAVISHMASDRVAMALSTLDANCVDAVLEGLEFYATALHRTAATQPTVPNPVAPRGTDIEIKRGYQPGVVGRTVAMHASYYSRMVGFGLAFEAKLGREMAAFVTRLESPRNAIWAARADERIVGAVTIDGEDMGDGIAHLRWFILDEGYRGMGIGGRLVSAAMAFVDETGFDSTHLWTFRGLDAARHLYERAGFTLVEERPGDQWGETVHEQRFVRARR